MTYDDLMGRPETNPEGAASRVLAALRGFAEEMAEQNIHIGVGSTGHSFCVIDAEPWPCSYEQERTNANYLTRLRSLTEEANQAVHQVQGALAQSRPSHDELILGRQAAYKARNAIQALIPLLDGLERRG